MQAELSIIMAAHNSQKTIKQTIDSILNQTFSSFELIIVNDGSNDDTVEIIRSIKDSRIILHEYSQCMGAAAARNLALKAAQGEYIAIMDSDDIALREKFTIQISYLKRNPDIGLLASSAIIIDENDKYLSRYKLGAYDQKIRANMLFHNYFIHSSILFRRGLINDGLCYDVSLVLVEDYDFLNKLLQRTQAASLSQALIKYRTHPHNMMDQFKDKRDELDSLVFRRLLPGIGLDCGDEDIKRHLRLKNSVSINSFMEISSMNLWLKKIFRNAVKSGYAQPFPMKKVILNRWLKVCFKMTPHPLHFVFSILLLPNLLFANHKQ